MSPSGSPPEGWGPPWHRFRHARPDWSQDSDWRFKRRAMFFRFARILVLVLLFLWIGIVGLSYLLTRLLGGGRQETLLVILVSAILTLAFPLTIGVVAMRSFRGWINPLARVMAAADAVAEGDFGVRVAETGQGEVGRLARSFNRMVSELEQSDRLRRNLTADVAHELRTPLHIIQGNLEGILDGIYPADPQQLELLLDETRLLSRLVEDLRTLSLAEAGQLPLNIEELDINELLLDVMTSFSGQAEAAGVKLRLASEPQPGVWTIRGDADRLDQVLSNLLANALRHTPSGGEITLCAQATQEGVRLRIADNGSGIPAEDLPYIFDRFWRGDPDQQKNADKGSGLGLAIARQLVHAHAGRITVESQVNQGTTFTIDLPGSGRAKPGEG